MGKMIPRQIIADNQAWVTPAGSAEAYQVSAKAKPRKFRTYS
jgi:hypothetical protein